MTHTPSTKTAEATPEQCCHLAKAPPSVSLKKKSSTETKLVGVDQALPSILHTQNFIESQGYAVEQNIILQDNQSTMQLCVNGSASSSKRSKRIKCRYFFIHDKIANGDVEVRYCPTETMWADVLTKPKQGGPFQLDRSHLMNIPEYCDKDIERTNTHPLLLPKDKRLAQNPKRMNNRVPTVPIIHLRSVLGVGLLRAIACERSVLFI